MSTINNLRTTVDQLRREAEIDRLRTSQTIAQLKEYVMEHQKDDYLCSPGRNPKTNPYREKSICQLL